jgi:uncharacterized protein (DUF2384 family)
MQRSCGLKEVQKTTEQLGELLSEMRLRHQRSVDQLTSLSESAEGSSVLERAAKVIGPGIKAADWLTSSQIGLNGDVPAVLALDPEGCEKVKTYLMQIEHGVYV